MRSCEENYHKVFADNLSYASNLSYVSYDKKPLVF